ncbi:DJ-1/PfpI family protein [Streptomyces alfalfae]|uniref:DJ-1/PfpI family protein n=1 Tax=Streptomyces alfalfae TaxID=1642299 RepID=A0A7T4U1Y6_9ACTN|nr:DJ-1/PfpI family protein [Streptomyces alfalfae]QQC93348.1 DJ-1/PfpI family protein [Streptomyces alfalfae]
MHIQVVLFDGFDPLDVIAPYEVLYAGGSVTDGAVTVELVTAEGPREVISGTGGLTLRAAGALDLERADMLVVPGASGRVGEPGEATEEPEEEAGVGERTQDELIPVLLGRTLTTELPALLKQAMGDPNITVATVCGGSLVLAMAGLLEGRHATTHHMGLDMLDATGAHAVRARVVDDGDLITGAGVTSGLDLGLYLLEREVGPRVAHAVEELFSHERRGTVWRAQGPTPTAL